MAHLKELTKFKEEAMRLIVTNPALMQLVVNNNTECFAEPVEKPGQYLYKNIYPYKHSLGETETEKKTYITMDIADFGIVNNHFKSMVIAIYIFTHRDLMRITEGGHNKVRVDRMGEEIEKLFNKARGFGIGALQFSGLQSLDVNDDFQGIVILYETMEFDVEPEKHGIPR